MQNVRTPQEFSNDKSTASKHSPTTTDHLQPPINTCLLTKKRNVSEFSLAHPILTRMFGEGFEANILYSSHPALVDSWITQKIYNSQARNNKILGFALVENDRYITQLQISIMSSITSQHPSVDVLVYPVGFFLFPTCLNDVLDNKEYYKCCKGISSATRSKFGKQIVNNMMCVKGWLNHDLRPSLDQYLQVDSRQYDNMNFGGMPECHEKLILDTMESVYCGYLMNLVVFRMGGMSKYVSALEEKRQKTILEHEDNRRKKYIRNVERFFGPQA